MRDATERAETITELALSGPGRFSRGEWYDPAVSSCALCGSGLDSSTVGQTCGGCEVVLTAREILTR